MPYWCAAFGPNNSYLLNSPRGWYMSGLPDRINSLFTTEPKAKQIHDIALGPNGSFAIIYTDVTGIKVRHAGLPHAVERWLLNHSGQAINAARDLSSMQISLGPNESYFAFDKNGCIWGGLPMALELDINERKDSNGCFKPGAYPYLVSLGAEGTYTMFTVSGDGTWYYGGQKQQLEQYLHGMRSLMHVGLILSPFNIDHYLLVTGQGVTAGNCPDTCTAAYLTFASDWRSSIEAETAPTPPPRPVTQAECPPALPPRRPSSIAADVQTRHSYIAYSPPQEHRPSLPPRPFSDSSPAYTAYAPATARESPLLQPPPAPQLYASAQQSPNVPRRPSPQPIHRKPVKGSVNPYALSPDPPAPPQAPYFPPPPAYSPNPVAIPPTDMKSQLPRQTSPMPPVSLPQTRQPQQVPASQPSQDYLQVKGEAKAKRNQRISAGLKMGKMAMQGLAIGAALVNIAAGNGGDIPSFDFGGSDVPDLPVSDVPDVPDVPVADTSAYWQPLQDCASMPIQ